MDAQCSTTIVPDETQNKYENENQRRRYSMTIIENTDDPLLSDSTSKQKIPYPKGVIFIIVNEFCERFMYYGIKTILVLYLTRKLFYTNDSATIIFHSFNTFTYVMCIFGAIISDSWLGKFKTALYMSILYIIGSTAVTIGSISTINLPDREIAIFGLLLVAIGAGGRKPCVAALGGDQFSLPDQTVQMTRFFSVLYFAINSGSVLAATITPILRQDFACFGEQDCFPLAFGVPCIMMLLSIIIFCIGNFWYTNRQPSENMIVQVCGCIAEAVATKIKKRETIKRGHWLDYAKENHGSQLIHDTKALLRVLILYIPLPVFWALCDLQGSRWTIQATQLNGNLGIFHVKPDQMFAFSSFVGLLFIPLNDLYFYRWLAKIGIKTPLQRITFGGTLAAISFIFSGCIELYLESTTNTSSSMNQEDAPSILWMIPQYVIMALGEVTFSVTGMQFSYSEAPDNMKSAVQALWQLNVAFGNLIDVVIIGVKIFDSQASEFFLFACVMLADMVIFVVLACRYKVVNQL